MERRCVWSRNLVNEEALAHWGAVAPQTNNPVELSYVFYLQNFVVVSVSYFISVTLPTHSNKRESFLERWIFWFKKVKVKCSRYRPGVAQRVGRGIALLFHDRGTRRGWVVSSTPRPHFTPGKDPVPILQEAGWDPGPVWTGGNSRPHRDSIPDRAARSQSLYRLSCPAHEFSDLYT